MTILSSLRFRLSRIPRNSPTKQEESRLFRINRASVFLKFDLELCNRTIKVVAYRQTLWRFVYFITCILDFITCISVFKKKRKKRNKISKWIVKTIAKKTIIIFFTAFSNSSKFVLNRRLVVWISTYYTRIVEQTDATVNKILEPIKYIVRSSVPNCIIRGSEKMHLPGAPPWTGLIISGLSSFYYCAFYVRYKRDTAAAVSWRCLRSFPSSDG